MRKCWWAPASIIRENGAEQLWNYAALKGKKGISKKDQIVLSGSLSSFSPRMKIGTYLAEPPEEIMIKGIEAAELSQKAEQLLEKVRLPRDFLMRLPTGFSADSCSARGDCESAGDPSGASDL